MKSLGSRIEALEQMAGSKELESVVEIYDLATGKTIHGGSAVPGVTKIRIPDNGRGPESWKNGEK